MAEVHDFDILRVAGEMQRRYRTLLSELQEFVDYLKQQEKENLVDLRAFKTGLEAEMKVIDKLATADDSTPAAAHSLQSSNLPYYEAVWSISKHCEGVTNLTKRIYWESGPGQSYTYGKTAKSGPKPPWKSKSHSQGLDIVAQNGSEWVKVSLATEKRIIWDLTKAGWAGSSNGSDSGGESPQDDDDDVPPGLLKQAEVLVKASLLTRFHYRHPRVRIELPRIPQDCAKEVLDVLQRIRDLGVTVLTSDDLPKPSPLTPEVLQRMTPDPYVNFSDVLNIDCTVLLAFVSDVSHGRVEPQHWHNPNLSRQIDLEREELLLPKVLFPACGSRKLVCTRDGAETMLKIVETLGTETERERTALLLRSMPEWTSDQFIADLPTLSGALKEDKALTEHQRRERYQELSEYQIPPRWKIPIEVVDTDNMDLMSKLPQSAETVSQSLTEVNRSVFLYGWAMGITTMSSNGAAAKSIEKGIEANRQNDDEAGPHIWLSPTTRSLVGKEKTRRGGNSSSKVEKKLRLAP